MRARGGIWAAGVAGSVLAHAGALALLAWAILPSEIEDQPLPQTELEVEAHRLQRDAAREAQPEAEAAQAEAADGDSVAAGSVPQSRARPAPATTETAAPVSGAGDRVAQARATPEQATPAKARPVAVQPADRAPAVTAPVATPSPDPVAAQRPEPDQAARTRAEPAAAAQATPAVARLTDNRPAAGVVLASARPRPARLPQARAETPPVTPATLQPETATSAQTPATPAPPAAPDAADLPPAPARAQAALADTPEGPAAAQAELPADRVKAALAFAGGDGNVDPASLAAFQSFMRPGDLPPGGDPLRDGVSTLLSRVPCSRLQVQFDPETTTLQVKGHVPEDGLRAPVLQALQARMGADITVSDNILILPRPQCGALSGIAGVGLPQSTDQITNPLLIGADTQARVLDYVKDDPLWFDLTAPEYDAYVYVDYFDAGGNVLHLSPNEHVSLQNAAADNTLRVGAKNEEDTGLRLFIGPPYGQEIAVAFAASHPLYDGVRPIVEPAAPYLDWLRDKVAQARETHPDFKGEWVYFFVSTSEN